MASPSSQTRRSDTAASARAPATTLVATGFAMTHRALDAFVVVRGEDGHVQMCAKMDHLGDDRWALTLRLPPGRYGYRYYAIHERVTTYVSPRDVETESVRMRGLDGIRIVPPP